MDWAYSSACSAVGGIKFSFLFTFSFLCIEDEYETEGVEFAMAFARRLLAFCLPPMDPAAARIFLKLSS